MAMTENGQLYLPGLLALNDLLGLGKNLSGEIIVKTQRAKLVIVQLA